MNWSYSYTSYLWPNLASAIFVLVLGLYGWRRRKVPGARAFAFLMLFWSLIAIGASLVLTVQESDGKIFWFKFQFYWQGLASVAGLFFVLEYARLDRFLTRRFLIPWYVFIILGSLLIFTNDTHHWVWTGFVVNEEVRLLPGKAYWILATITYLTVLLTLPALIWLFIRSPHQRWPVAIILLGQLVVRAAIFLDATDINPVAPLSPIILASTFLAVALAVALFGFHIFDPVRIARKTVIEQMHESMLVLDTQGVVISLNPAAEKNLGIPAGQACGKPLTELVPSLPDLSHDDIGISGFEIGIGTGQDARYYSYDLSTLTDRRGANIGHLLLLHDVTDNKKAQEQLLEQGQVVAILQERERLARELHDSLGQVLGYVSMQAQAIQKWVRDGNSTVAETQLARLARTAQQALNDLRESILNLKSDSAEGWSFFHALQHHLESYRDYYAVDTELVIPTTMSEDIFEPSTKVHLLRVIQEVLTKARMHGHARCAQVMFERQNSHARVVVTDDGNGFDLGQVLGVTSNHYGLAFMRERMAQIDGRLVIESRPGMGTRVVLDVPICIEPEVER